VAGKVSSAGELIGGEIPTAQPGKAWKLANHAAAFVIQGNEAHVGYTMYGGSLLDADVQREGGEGLDTFRESFPVVGYRLPTVDSIAVLCDGNGGRPAVLRLEGTDAPSRILPQIDALARPLTFRIVTDYILEPDSRTLRVRTSATNEGVRTWGSLAMGDLLLFGSVNTLFSPEAGFGDLMTEPPSLIVTATDPEEARRHVSYGFAGAHGTLDLPIVDEGLTGAVGYIVHTLLAGETAVYERRFTVGRDPSEALEPLLEFLERPYAEVSGTVTDPDGDPVESAAVVAFAAAGGPAASQAVSQADGFYRLVVPPGSYDLVVAKAGYARGAGDTGGALAEGDTANVDLELGATGNVALEITAGGGEPVPAKVTLYGVDVEAPDRRLGPIRGERESMGAHRVLWTADGTGMFAVKPGTYRAVVSRGPEYRFVEREITVPVAGSVLLNVEIERAVDTTGWLAGEFHIHTVWSPDGQIGVCERVRECAAEGLDVAVSTDHEGPVDYAPCVDSLGLQRFLATMVGQEVTNMGSGGHRNAYPMPYDPEHLVEEWGPQYWVGLSAQELNDKLHAESAATLVQMNHPRSTDSYTNWSMFDPTTGEVLREDETLATGWNAIELANGSSYELGDVALYLESADETIRDMADGGDRGDIPVFHDYLAFLALGWPMTAMGTSDGHRPNEAGYARSYLRIDKEDPAEVTDDDIVDAVRGQRVVVSNGIFVRVTAEGEEVMGRDEVVAMTGEQVELYVQAEALPEITVARLHVFANGRPLYLRRETDGIAADETDAGGGLLGLEVTVDDGLDEIVQLASEVRHRPTVDTYYNVVVGGSGDMDPLPSSGPFAFTNAIYVDVDGGGWDD
jgi:hypothetical protein